MKKLLLIAAASTALLTSGLSFADCDMNSSVDSSTNSSMSSSVENQWYLKLNAGGVIFNKTKPKGADFKLNNIKSNTGFTGEIGAGYYIMDNLRTDLTIGTVASSHLKKSKTYPDGNSFSVKNKPTIVSVLLNGYVDFVDLSMFKVFAGAGVGAAFVKEKINSKDIKGGVTDIFNGTTKNKTNFAYQLSLGTSFEVAQGVKAELVYSWRDYGKTKNTTKTIDGDKVKFGGTHYKGHNLMVGLRFDM
ncbi:MAG TPA: porin family protein [Rickettsia endosymbiont of Proechinophthirus fluctus]|uniref:outer membrane protein n=1 Tax=Rickettsia endosymbiont of Proechinophthirus fluctus TaxID=1462733 RepID=UPI000789D7DC|nr:outer membrane protein [Rickettsia endosymbiont of Proechinophthirus fluctus]KYP98913.1 adhesin [Rickettsia endosymbiont of Proechinophthirus fluctus]HJD54019.1 porin family protein [Rickettsia endosymbiont of Proechinophthirus fluctus]